MPELVEVELYRRCAESLIGRTIADVTAHDDWYCKGQTTPVLLRTALTGQTVAGTRRHGKLLVLDMTQNSRNRHTTTSLGLRFGMTGRLVVDGAAPIETLLYSSTRDDPAWDRFTLHLGDGGRMVMRDPRRLGGVELNPNPTLGPDAATLTARQLQTALSGVRAPLKAALLDQARVAGIGNLIVDEVLWRVGLVPQISCADLASKEISGLAAAIRSTIAVLTKRGGSHLGDHVSERHRSGHCPRDGAPLVRSVVGGRTTYHCPAHQSSLGGVSGT